MVRLTPTQAAAYVDALANLRRKKKREDTSKVFRWFSLLETCPEARAAFNRPRDRLLYQTARDYTASDLDEIAAALRAKASQ